jgi:hypothetical protein
MPGRCWERWADNLGLDRYGYISYLGDLFMLTVECGLNVSMAPLIPSSSSANDNHDRLGADG